MDTVILIPAYKPDMALIHLVDQLNQVNDLHVLVVDDGSGDEFTSVFAKLAGKATLTGYETNHGKGYALKHGFKAVSEFFPDAKYIITADADGQHKIEDILSVRKHLKQGEDFVIGARQFTGKVPFRSRFGNGITQFVFRYLAKTNVSDTQTGLRGFTYAMLPELLSIPGERYEYETYMLLHFSELGIKIAECPIATVYENNNQSSHFHPLRDSFKIYKAIFSFSKPAKFIVSSFIAFLLDTAILMALLVLGVHKAISIGIGWFCGSLVNFAVNRYYVFHSKVNLLTALSKYYLLALVVMALKNYGLYILLTDIIHFPEFPGKLLAEISFFLLNYVLQQKLIFRMKRS